MVQLGTVPYGTAWYSIIWLSLVQYHMVQLGTVPYGTAWYSTICGYKIGISVSEIPITPLVLQITLKHTKM
jgi:hypothetical protein